MELDYALHTCSMAEVVCLEASQANRPLTEELAARVGEATGVSRKMLVANVSTDQAGNEELIVALKANGFKRVGMYYGNSEQYVHVYIRGLRTRATKK